ncbi:hypothetical protein ACRQ5Q_42695 (plasmid) [Bradyrhizobium sp. PMVTL-01]|uniref:hypothetical protein n=1 Tax=Bradyrhizobium sp. PMVTL-01 TaxID=3434999 RepID=UPI003F6FAFC5
MHEILHEMKRRAGRVGMWRVLLSPAVLAGGLTSDRVAGADARKLSGVQIRARLAGMQLTDEVHYRFVYEREGTLRSYGMGTKKIGKWSIEKDELCLWFGEHDDGCYAVKVRGERLELIPSGIGGALDGICSFRRWRSRDPANVTGRHPISAVQSATGDPASLDARASRGQLSGDYRAALPGRRDHSRRRRPSSRVRS